MMGTYDTTDAQQRLAIEDMSTAGCHEVRLLLARELDGATVPRLCDTVVDVMADGKRHLVLDLSAITWCDNASLYTLLGIRSALQHADGSLTLSAASSAIRRALDRSGLCLRLPLTPGTDRLPPQPPVRPVKG
ncbi:STAS domain-containing protein [Streptomyces sp. ISL-100]|uniref:STAS domain-containing protein n=1 Tax=Streptomyces sp. ISL-100 TaxID=2819173 RepID=UPI001BECF525|nr:STAS domain-containing protein [Streptomyces sp. ISL-100]MBT2401816.1 STAS domain-containing protein [Streptomyces sp. ISL-100]